MPADGTAERAQCAIAVMAKAPRAARVKTRLVPPLTQDEASALSGCFLRDITANLALAGRAAAIDSYIAYAPAGSVALFDDLVAPGTRFVLADGSAPMPPGVEGFGRCLLHAAQGLFAQGHAAACLLNSDSPTLPTAVLVETARALAAPGDRVVLGAAEDGGYYLLGMKAPHAALFRDIAWSTDGVAEATRARAAALGLEVVSLPVWFDVDDAAALRRLVGALDARAPGYAAPETARWLAAQRIAERLDGVAVCS